MIGFDKTITIYNQWYERATKTTKWFRTVVTGASWAGNQRTNVVDGMKASDAYSVRIPMINLPACFIPRDEYVSKVYPQGCWTVQNGDCILLGEGPDVINGITEITKNHTNCFIVTAVNIDNMMRLLPHLRIKGE